MVSLRRALALFLCLLAVCGCAAAHADTAIVVTDMLGREVVLPSEVQRVVALMPSDCEILYALGAEDLLVGRGEYCDYPPEVLEIPSVESGFALNVEQIIAVEPDVVFMTKMGQTDEQVAQLEAAGITVVMTDGQDIAGTYEEIALVGAVVGKSEEADALIADMQAGFAELAANAASLEGMTVYFETSALAWGLYSAGPGTFMDEIASLVGLTNIFGDVDLAWPSVSEEQVIALDPDIIVTITMYDYLGEDPVEEILSREGWQDISAVKNGAVLNLVNNELSRPAPRLVDGARALAEFAASFAADDAA